MNEEPPQNPLAEIGRYARLSEARDRGLIVASMELPHWIMRQGREYVLCVEEQVRERAAQAVAEFDAEEQSRQPLPVLEPLAVPKFAVLMSVLGLVLCFAIQRTLPDWLIDRGIADSELIRAREWWRSVTALTLHGGAEHLVSNLWLAIFVFSFVMSRFGVGIGLAGIVIGGAAGNMLNAVLHLAWLHRSLGSSTALFAGLGLLAGGELAARLKHHSTRTRWSILLPIGAGVAFLSFFGSGGGKESNVDLGAHLFGLLAGTIAGGIFEWLGAVRGIPRWLQMLCGTLAIGLLAGAWVLASLPQ